MGRDITTSNVILLAERRRRKQRKEVMLRAAAPSEPADEELTFEQIMARNEANRKRLARERETANKSVLRSYRMKP